MHLKALRTFFHGLRLHIRPEFGQRFVDLPDLGLQQHEVIGRAEAAMLQEIHCSLATNELKARLQ